LSISLYIKELDNSHVGHIFAMAPHTRHEQKISTSLTVLVSNSDTCSVKS